MYSARLLVAAMLLAISAGADRTARAGGEQPVVDRGGNALWMRRHWMHEAPTQSEIADLVAVLRAHGVLRIYPFLGPMDKDGWPGWRSKAGLVRYEPERAGAFLKEIHVAAPEIRVLPWTGGIAGSDVHLEDPMQRHAFAGQARQLIELGADGVHLNIEPLPSGAPGYLEFLREVKSAIGAHTLSVAAYAPPTPLAVGGDEQWEMRFFRDVCKTADEIAVMGYNTGAASPQVFENIVSGWMRQLSANLPAPEAKGCEWLMGVPAYDDDKDYHRPGVETIEHSLNGIVKAMQGTNIPGNFRGIAIYASFTMDEAKWAAYDRIWRRSPPVALPPPDPRNTTD